jgi:hypothetical protein
MVGAEEDRRTNRISCYGLVEGSGHRCFGDNTNRQEIATARTSDEAPPNLNG